MGTPATLNGGAQFQNDTYERNPVNDCQLGKEFEVNVAIYSVLTLLQNEQRAIAIECKSAPAKFDDVVLRVQNGSDYEYYYRQLKHKDPDKDPEACYITWNELLRTKKNPKDTKPPFGLAWYYETLMRGSDSQNATSSLSTPNALNNVKELGFVTNYNLAKKDSGEGSNLEDLAQKLLYPTSKETKHFITENDLKNFFEEWSDPTSWRPPSNDQKSYKFKDAAIEAITKGTQAGLNNAANGTQAGQKAASNKSLDLSLYGAFLKLLVFHVSMPHVNDLKVINQNLLKVFLPFHKNVLTDKYVKITGMFSSLFAITTVAAANATGQNNGPSSSPQAKWATSECRRRILEDMTIEWTEKYWTDAITNFRLAHNQMKPWDFIAAEMLHAKNEWNVRNPMKVVNIINAYSNPAIITLKVLNTLQNMPVKRKILIKQVTDKKSFDDTIGYFEQLDEEVTDFVALVSETFCCAIAISPAYECSELEHFVQRLISMRNLRKWIRFAIITQQPIILDGEQSTDFERIGDTMTLNWQELTDEYMDFLFEKTLYLANSMVTSLKALGFHKGATGELLKPRALSEIMVHDNESPLNLGLPKKDVDLDTDYIEREIQLPPSGRTINETELLKDNANFGNGTTGNKLLVIVDLPGKGKSSLMTSLSNRFIDGWSNNSNRLLIRVNLHEIKHWDKKHSGIAFLLIHSKVSGNNPKSEHLCLTETIVEQMCSNGPPSVFVLLDGYDEISDEQRGCTLDAVDDLLKAKGIKRIILTSRPEANLERELEKRFNQSSLRLNNFDRDTQIRYLIKRWTSQISRNGYVVDSGEKIKNFAEKLIDFARSALEHENKTFLDIPLQCWIFSECFFRQLLDYLESNNKNDPEFEEESFAILNLYDGFYEAKINVLFQEKAHMPMGGNEALAYLKSELKHSIMTSMMRISIIHLMEIEDAQIIGRFSWDAYRRGNNLERDSSKYARDLKRAMKLGVIQGQQEENGSLSDTRPQEIRFLHRTFAEYFFAKYLFQSFTQDQSKLLDSTILTNANVMENTHELISEKVLKFSQYAGVRRFLDRMLAQHVPPVGEQCPFAKFPRSNVLKTWPVIGHKKFNEHLAKSIISKNAADYAKQPISKHSNASELSDDDYKRLRTQVDKGIGIASFMRNGCEKEPHITSMLVHCIKEYASRQDTFDQHTEIFARSVTLTALSCVLKEIRSKESDKANSNNQFDKVTSCLLHWLDRSVESPNNHVFSKWIFVFLNFVIREAEENISQKSNLIVPACKMLEFHNTAPDFDRNIYNMATLRLFAMTEKRRNNIYGERFTDLNQLSSYAVEFWFKSREVRIADRLFEGILVSLSDRNVLSPVLLNGLVSFLVNKFAQYTKQAAHYPKPDDFRDVLKKSDNEKYVSKSFKTVTDSHRKFMMENAIRPYAFIETVKLFIKNASTTAEFLNASLKYIALIQPLALRMNHHTDLYLMRHWDSEALYVKFESISIILWYFLVADAIIPHLPDSEVLRVTQKIFFSEIGHKSLMAYAHATCCCKCKTWQDTGFGIHFPRDDQYDPDLINGPFRRLFADKLKFLWNNWKGEIEFIDFLFKRDELVLKDEPKNNQLSTNRFGSFMSLFGASNQIQRPQQTKKNLLGKAEGKLRLAQAMVSKKHEPAISRIGSVLNLVTGAAKETKDSPLERAERTLRAIQIAKLPCLLFSDVVSEYIPGKLSQAGLKHLIDTLEKLPLFHCEGSCFEAKGNISPVFTDTEMSLLDGITQEEATSSRIFRCSGRSAQIDALRKKLKGDAAEELD